MKRSVYFSVFSAIYLLCIVVPNYSFSQEEEEVLVKETVLAGGEELKLPLDCDTFVQIDITAKNQVEEEAEFWYTLLLEGEELSEDDIGPLSFRTYTLGPKSSEKHKKTMTLDCSEMDELHFQVNKGKIHFVIIGRTSY
jgi:hypothetical protein